MRECLLVAESELTGGASPRVIPFADARALGGLLQRAGFALPVVDSDRFTRALRRYVRADARPARLRGDQRADRPLAPFRPAGRCSRARRALYAERFADPDGRVRATFEILWLSGWAPHPSQPKPLAPGSAKIRLEDAVKAKANVTAIAL